MKKEYTKPCFEMTGKKLYHSLSDFICPYCGNHGYTFLLTEGKIKIYGRILNLSDNILDIAEFKFG